MKKYLEATDIELIRSGTHFFDVLENLISGAHKTLHLQTYIFECDESGLRILMALKLAAKRGVQVFLLVDAFGSKPFPPEEVVELQRAGVQFRFFSPFLSSENRYVGRRMHHKIAVADKYTGLITGINIANKYNSNMGLAWLDFGIRCKGPLNEYLHLLCEQFYEKKGGGALRNWEKLNPNTGAGVLRYRRNDWLRRHNEIHRSYVEAITKAKKSIIVVASYFLPGNNFRNLLRNASKRGVDIRIILAGKTDLPTVRLAENYLFDYYFRNNIRIFEYKESVLHGKAMVVDGNWATLGSYNLNFLSHYFSTEMNADIVEPEFVRVLSKELQEIVDLHCSPVHLHEHLKRQNVLLVSVRWMTYNFFRFMMNLFMMGYKFRKKTGR